MGHARVRARGVFVLSAVLASVLTMCLRGFALDPSLDVNQYAHTVWRVREGFSKGTVQAIAQTPDGYLWLGTDLGLLRFDGVRTVPWQPSQGQRLPSNYISSLVAGRDGALWIGSDKGLVSWKDGNLTPYPELAGQVVARLVEDREGVIWVGGSGGPNGKLCAIQNSTTHCNGEDGSLGPGVEGLYQDSKGNLWVGVKDGLWRWKPGTPKFYSMPDSPDGIQAFAEGEDGSLLIGTPIGISRLVEEKFEPYSLPGTSVRFRSYRMLRDRDDGLWIVTLGQGILHVHQGRTDVYTETDGLSGNDVYTIFEDREGDIWVATLNGFGRFRDFAVPTLTAKQGLSSAVVGSVLTDKDRSVWFGTRGGLNRWIDGRVSVFGKDGTLNGDIPNSLFQDSRGRVWISTIHGFGYLENGKFVSIRGLPADNVRGIAEDNAGNLWIAEPNSGLFRLSPAGGIQQIPWAGLGHKDPAVALIADHLHGGLWLGFYNGGIADFSDGGIRASYSSGNGLGEGSVNDLRVDPDGTLWVSTENGLSRLKSDRVVTLTSKNGLPCDAVHWAIEDNDHFFWLYMPCGLVRIARSELEALAATVDKDKNAKPTVRFALFDSSDGVRTLGRATGYVQKVAKSADGRLWFLPTDGVSVIDPQHLAFNKLPPPVHIEQITADRKTYDATPDSNRGVSLPPRVRDLEIDYTALSLVAPEKVLFRYKLEGWDRDWQEARTRRQAFYSNLPPRNYTFRVMACNNSGVWNEAGASLDFSVAPAYYQTNWFRLTCIVASLAALWGLHRFRLWQLAREFNMRLDERVSERTRIAGELHDTLLQNIQGLILKFHAIGNRISTTDPTRQEIEKTLDYADQVMAEGRDRVRNLRASTIRFGGLPKAFEQVVEEVAPNRSSTFKTVVEGTVLELHPIIREEIYSIGREALINALTHAEAHHIEAEITYEPREFHLRIRDDGRGIDSEILEKGGRDDHWGLQGMRERAKRIGGRLDLWSRPDSGTEVDLRVPASKAYRSPRRESTDSGSRVSAQGTE